MCARLASREVVMKAEGMPENRAKCREETFDVEAPWMERIWAGRAQGESLRRAHHSRSVPLNALLV